MSQSDDPGRDLWLRLVRQHASEPGSLSPEELTYYAVCLLDGETFINGIAGYFESTSSASYGTAVHGLKLIGAEDYLALVQRGKTLLFGDAALPSELEQREQIVRDADSRGGARIESELKDVGRQMFALSQALGIKLEAYARKHEFWPEGR